jgi:hypothetical protein
MGTSAQRRKAGRELSPFLPLTENKRGTGAQLARQNIHPVLADKKARKRRGNGQHPKEFSLLKLN